MSFRSSSRKELEVNSKVKVLTLDRCSSLMAVEINDLLYVSLEQCGEIRLGLKGLFGLIRVLMDGVGCIVH